MCANPPHGGKEEHKFKISPAEQALLIPVFPSSPVVAVMYTHPLPVYLFGAVAASLAPMPHAGVLR